MTLTYEHRVPDKRRGPRNRRRLWLTAAALAASLLGLVAVIVVGGWLVVSSLGDEGPPVVDLASVAAPALYAADDPARGAVRIVGSGSVISGPVVEVKIEPPHGATEIQLGFGPILDRARWRPVPDTGVVEVEVHDVGYQILLARFRHPGGVMSPVSVDGVTIDPTYDAAVASASGIHQISWVRPLNSTSLVVRIESGRIERGEQIAYDFDEPVPGDSVSDHGGVKSVHRNGEPFGQQVPGQVGLLATHGRIVGEPLDLRALDAGAWTVSSVDDQAYQDEQPPLTVSRVSRPLGTTQSPEGDTVAPMVTDVILTMAQPLSPDASYLVTPPADLVKSRQFVYAPKTTVSPAIQVNQAGYSVADSLKVGYLGGMLSKQGSVEYRDGLEFSVVDQQTDTVVHSGLAVARPNGDEMGRGDLAGSEVHELDFSSVAVPGRYRLCVDLVGCSESFTIGDNTWLTMAGRVARAMYHQRSGVALGPPYTSIPRPRPYHPSDGVVVKHTDHRLVDSQNVDEADVFKQTVAKATNEEVTDAWGGHFDAGDWDRRIQHLAFVRTAVELVESYPELFSELDLNIPESGDQVPDMLDEALWTLDAYTRLQTAEGGIRGGIEASEHPQTGSTSWTEILTVYAFAPDPWSSYQYAGAAAQMAAELMKYDEERAVSLVGSATLAMEWAEGQSVEPINAERTAEQRLVAAAALYKATEDPKWHDLFVGLSPFTEVDNALTCNAHGKCDAAWLYLTTDELVTDADIRSTLQASVIATADEVIRAASTTSYGFALENPNFPLVWGLGVGGSPSSIGLMRAYQLTGDDKYREAALRSAAVSLGANPLGAVYITGVGQNPVRHPLIIDTLNGGLPVWPGIPVYGNHHLNSQGDDSWVDNYVLRPNGTHPLGGESPYMWQWFDVSGVAMFGEFTVHQSYSEALYAFGMLAGSSQ